MTSIHRNFGLVLAGVFLIVGLWGLLGWFRNKDPGAGFWRALAAGQVGLGVQAVIAIVVFAGQEGPRPHFLHYVYGGFPVFVLYLAHKHSKKIKGLEWLGFAFAALFIFGLQLRGLMTGTGN